MGKALSVARQLRLAGKPVNVYPEGTKKVKQVFSYARVGAIRIAFVAPDECSKGLVRIKDLRNFDKDTPDDVKQKDVPFNDLANVDSYFGGTKTSESTSFSSASCLSSLFQCSSS